MNKKIKKLALAVFLVLPLVLTANFAVAHFAGAQTDLGLNAGAQIGLGSTDPKTLIVNIIRVALGFLALAAVIIIIYGGWLWMTAGGNAEKIEKAKRLLRNAVIGLIIILSAFAIVSFLITKFGPPGPESCDPPCAAGQYCCSGSCQSEPCSVINPDPNAFGISGTVPRNNDSNVIRNVVVRAYFNKQIDNSTSQETLEENFKVEDTGSVAKNGKIIASYPPKIIALVAEAASTITGTVATSSEWQEINFRAAAECGDERNTPNCLPAKRQIQVTINSASGIKAEINGQSLSCPTGTCRFTFTTGNLIDTESPTAGIVPAQICHDDGTLEAGANTVGGWGRDDIGIGVLKFYYQKSGAGETQAYLIPGNLETYQFASYKYDTTAMAVGDKYAFKVRAEDLAAAASTASFNTTIKPAHCCNGVKDADEADVDCGGTDCLACEGGACNREEPNQCGTNNSNCADELCSTSYCQCTTANCICKKRPVIYGITPYGGFCDGDVNKYCQTDIDCAKLSPATCNKDTANGAPSNFLTIYGKNFGVVKNLLENVLTNVNFEQGILGKVPTDWTVAYQNHSWVGTVSEAGNYATPVRSVKIHQDPNQPYPGVCSEELCKHQGIYDKFPYPCEWRNENGVNKCVFPRDVLCGDGECKIDEGKDLIWTQTNRVMWYKLTYNISKLDFKVGDKYVLRFKYKGRTQKNVNILAGYNLGSASQAWSKAQYKDPNCIINGGKYCSDNPGKCQCADAPDYCCYQAPVQTKPYGAFYLSPIKAGSYSDWQSYESYFTYTDEMDRLRDRNGKKVIEVGLTSNNYFPTDPEGTDMYIDDFIFARVASKAGVQFVGVKADSSDDKMGIFPTDLNPDCISSWTDKQIVIAVPGGTVGGSIDVTGENGLADATDDQYGPKLNDFVANTIERPGICRLANNKCLGDPLCLADHGLLGDTLTYYGLNLSSGSKAYFGDWWGSNVQGVSSAFGLNGDKQGTAGVANIYPGLTTSFVAKGKVSGNNLYFTKDPEPYTGPQIISFDPTSGAIGQYVTIRGRGFGSSKGTSKVFFGGTGGAEASYDFPVICKDSVWSDKQVVVKVPKEIANGNYLITMQIGSEIIDTSKLARPNFTVNASLSLAPSLCRLEPIIGPVKSQVSVWGEYFGVKDANSKIRFYLNKDQSGTALSYWGVDDTQKEGIKPDKAVTLVPKGAITGPVRVVKNSSGLLGNGLNFTVGECSKNEECGNGEDGKTLVCCPADSPSKGRCQASLDKCYSLFTSCVYEWDFNTSGGNEGDPCDSELDQPGCQIGQCNTGLVCDSTDCICKVPCSSDKSKCVPNDLKCTGYKKCNKNTCFCDLPGPDACSGYNLTQCLDSLYCPNSPGNCSANQNPYQGNSCTNSECDVLCGQAVCAYNKDINKCLAQNNTACDLSSEVIKNYNGQDYTFNKYCARYNSGNYWHYKGSGNCDLIGTGWKNLGNKICVKESADNRCDLCANNLKCVDEAGKIDGSASDNRGVCGLAYDICPSGYQCNSTKGRCEQVNPGYCECCCDINQNTLTGNPGCCAPLKCGNDCGSGGIDKSNPANGNYSDTDDVDFGKCSGCANVGTTQAEHDEACNCPGTTGKYCDMTDSETTGGVCQDCTQIGSPVECTGHEATCCVNGKDGNKCKGLAGNKNLILNDDPNLAYCSYYNCKSSGDYQCDASNPTTTGTYDDNNCGGNCGQLPGNSCYDNAQGNCSLICAFTATYQCYGDTGCEDMNPAPPPPACSAGDKSCLCCCDPGDDKCGLIDTKDPTTKLTCHKDKIPCTTNYRGLCCGCKEDKNCGAPDTIGCSSDTCCRARPQVASTYPADGALKVCRNAEISATFDQLMDTTSFASNIIVVGEYSNSCPDGTSFLVKGNPPAKSFWKKLLATVTIWAKKIARIREKTAVADTPSPDKIYCAIPGQVVGFEGKQLRFKINRLLDSDTHYFAIIKGDPTLDDNVNEGILSNWKVGMNGPDNLTFNSVEYKNAYVWSFVTKANTEDHKGICPVEYANVSPESYLIHVNTNDAGENDTDRNVPTYDTVDDVDKEFIARARSADGQILTPVIGYAWNWTWKIDNTLIVSTSTRPINIFLINPANNLTEYQLIAATGEKEGETFARAKINLTDTAELGLGDGKEGEADIFVMYCKSPWPAINSNGTWFPEKDARVCSGSAGQKLGYCPVDKATGDVCFIGLDQGTCKDNCTITDAGCFYTNQEIYYCRDKGVDINDPNNLPEIFGDAVRGSSTIQDVLKEFYYLRH